MSQKIDEEIAHLESHIKRMRDSLKYADGRQYGRDQREITRLERQLENLRRERNEQTDGTEEV